MKTKVIIIEDEPKAQKHLENLLALSGFDLVVEAVLPSVESTIQWFEQNTHPDLVFLDIHLSDGISFEILEKTALEAPIIFTTAYDEYAIKAFKTTGIDYLLKPLTEEEVSAALAKYFKAKERYVRDWFTKTIGLKHFFQMDIPQGKKERFLFKSGNEMLPFHVDEIAYFFKGKIVFAKMLDGSEYSINTSLNQIQTMVDPNTFVRLNRQLLVSIKAISRVKSGKGGQLLVALNPKHHEQVVVSQERAGGLKKVLGQI
ncbi:MAG: LytTR family DNA-binding domain-containing protein [Bacteroidota bacterium]